MKYCEKCGSEIQDEAVVCPNCGCATTKIIKEGKAIGICAIIFGALGGLIGLVLGIVGLNVYKERANRINSAIGLGLFCLWAVVWIVIRISLF
ncbi:MAG TPA: zinc ribbon domain-containing protein [Eubacteriales bacterium]|nr:zinc ribbon domain-containing protein [Eubacteriales bacterium]